MPTIYGDPTFTDSSSNNGSVSGTATFTDVSLNTGVVLGSATFADTSVNSGSVSGAAVFSDTSVNDGLLASTVTFTGSSSNTGVVLGGATFADTSINNGAVSGNALFTDTSSNTGEIGSTVTFTGSSSNTGVVLGDAIFADTSTNNGSVSGAASFSPTAEDNGEVAGASIVYRVGYYSDGYFNHLGQLDGSPDTTPHELQDISGSYYTYNSHPGQCGGADGYYTNGYFRYGTLTASPSLDHNNNPWPRPYPYRLPEVAVDSPLQYGNLFGEGYYYTYSDITPGECTLANGLYSNGNFEYGKRVRIQAPSSEVNCVIGGVMDREDTLWAFTTEGAPLGPAHGYYTFGYVSNGWWAIAPNEAAHEAQDHLGHYYTYNAFDPHAVTPANGYYSTGYFTDGVLTYTESGPYAAQDAPGYYYTYFGDGTVASLVTGINLFEGVRPPEWNPPPDGGFPGATYCDFASGTNNPTTVTGYHIWTLLVDDGRGSNVYYDFGNSGTQAQILSGIKHFTNDYYYNFSAVGTANPTIVTGYHIFNGDSNGYAGMNEGWGYDDVYYDFGDTGTTFAWIMTGMKQFTDGKYYDFGTFGTTNPVLVTGALSGQFLNPEFQMYDFGQNGTDTLVLYYGIYNNTLYFDGDSQGSVSAQPMSARQDCNSDVVLPFYWTSLSEGGAVYTPGIKNYTDYLVYNSVQYQVINGYIIDSTLCT